MESEKIRVLVVEDSSTMRRILINCLAKIGYTNVTEACNGVEALAKCREGRFDCVFTDWNMPEMDGLEFVTRLRQMPEYAQSVVIMVTTEGARQDVIEALTRGVNSYVIKPFTPDVIHRKLQDALARAGM